MGYEGDLNEFEYWWFCCVEVDEVVFDVMYGYKYFVLLVWKIIVCIIYI